MAGLAAATLQSHGKLPQKSVSTTGQIILCPEIDLTQQDLTHSREAMRKMEKLSTHNIWELNGGPSSHHAGLG